jgi:hypothetical protein
MIKNNRNNEQIYGRNDMIMLEPNNKIYGSLGIADNYVMKTEEGTRLVLNNPKSGRFGDVLTEFNIYGKSSQNKTTGKNLLKIKDGTQTIRGVTITSKDGIITVNGTATETGWAYLGIETHTLADGTYIVHYEANNNNNKPVLKLVNAKWKEVIAQNVATALSNSEISKVCFVVAKDKTYNMTDVKIQLELGSFATSYEPYTGGIPSPNPDYPQEIKSVGDSGSIEVNVRGKNLWDNFKTLSLGNVEQKNGTYIATADTMQIDITNESVDARPLLLKANNAYTFSLKTTVSISSPKFVCLRYTNGEINNIIFTNKNFVNFVPERDVEKIGFILYESVAGDKAYDVQLEMGSEATPYEPYYEEQTVTLPYILNAIPVNTGGNYTDADGQQWIADYIDFKRGKLVKMLNSLTLDGDKLKFVADSTNTYWNLPQQSEVKPIGNDILSNYFRIRTFFSNEYYNFIYTIQNYMVGLFETVDELNAFVFKKYRENDPVVLYYGMQEPIETDLTLEQIEQYKKLNIRTPTTIVENNYNTWMKATYKSIESV